MSPVSKLIQPKRSTLLFVKQLQSGWNKVINIGIKPDVSDHDRKRVRLVNGICTWAVLIYIVYVVAYARDEKLQIVSQVSVAGALGYSLPIYLNHIGKHLAAFRFFHIFNLFFNLEQFFIGGEAIGVEYIFVLSCVTPLLFFRSSPTMILYFLANLLFFGIAKYSGSHFEPFVVYGEAGHSIYVANHVTMFGLLFMIVSYFRAENTRQEKLLKTRNVSLTDEKQKSDLLLLNILPENTADELKETGTAQSRSYQMVTIMFTDFKDFTKVAEKLSAEDLVNQIHHYFTAFDSIISRYPIEKIKTIGDSYMCAGGLPAANVTNAEDIVRAALEIRDFMLNEKRGREAEGRPFFEIRIGCHTGPVVAGIVGIKKFAYDIWGDAVNIASRVESSGEPGKINISGSTYELVKEEFTCMHRGKVEAKNKGLIDMYFVER